MEEKYIDVHGLSICYRQWGENPNVVILHGWLDQCASWDSVCRDLEKANFSTIAYDHRGHGLSGHAPQSSHYHFPDYVSDLDSLHSKLFRNDVPTTIIGHSMGGTIATIYASLFPEKVERLVLIEGLGPRGESPLEAKKRYKSHLQQRMHPTKPAIFKNLDEATNRLQKHNPQLPSKRAKELAQRIVIPHKEGWIWRFDPRHKEKSAVSFSEERHLALLSSIQAPCYLIFGRQSPYSKWIDVEKRGKHIPTIKQTYYIDGGHSPHLTHPNVLSSVLIQDCLRE